MQMDACGLNFRMSDGIERHIRRRVTGAIGRAPRSIEGVMVRLRDINGTRGGVDKACRIVVWLRSRGTVVVEAVDRNLHTAIDAAAMKLKEAVRRQLKRRRTLRREYAQRRLRRASA